MSDAPKPCPFCGCDPCGDYDDFADDGTYIVACPRCYVSKLGAKDEVIADWNRRVASPAHAGTGGPPNDAAASRALDERLAAAGAAWTERDKVHWLAGFEAGRASRTPPPALE